MVTEITTLEANNTWKIVHLPHGKKMIGCEWIYRVKYKPDGTERLKLAWLLKVLPKLKDWTILKHLHM